MSYIKALDVFFIISFFFVFGAVLEYIVVILHHEKKLKGEKKKEDRTEVEMVPLRQVGFRLLTKLRECMLLENSKNTYFTTPFEDYVVQNEAFKYILRSASI